MTTPRELSELLDIRGLHGQPRELERQRLLRAAMKQAGLTTLGTRRKQRTWPQLRGAANRVKWLAYATDWRQRNRAKGLTGFGKLPRVRRSAAVALDYHKFRATITIPELSFATGRSE